MSDTPKELTDHFPLTHMGGILRDFAPPEGSFDPAGAWTHRYKVYSLTGGATPAATVALRRSPAGDEAFQLSVDYEHPLLPDVFRRRFQARLDCALDPLATVRSWSCRGWAEDRSGAEQPRSRSTLAGRASEGKVILDGGRSLPFTPPLVSNWGLFEAVQRLPREAFEPKCFTLLDDFGRVKPEQSLCYRERLSVVAGGKLVKTTREEKLEKGAIVREVWARENARNLTVHVYDHVGRGVVPWTYWVDEAGRLLLAVSGIEGYVLDTEEG